MKRFGSTMTNNNSSWGPAISALIHNAKAENEG